MSATPPPAAASRPFVRSGFLIAMLAGAGVGALAARALERAVGGADPEFVGVLGAAFGGIVGRSLWMRIRRAREAGRSMAPPMLLLLTRIALCAVVALSLFGPAAAGWAAPARTAIAVAGMLAFSAVGIVEYRWLRQPDHPGTPQGGAPRVD